MHRYTTFVIFLLLIGSGSSLTWAAADRPNVVWLTSEDNGPQLGCYGDEFADTPNLDALAEKGMIFNVCWSNAPVCAPARTTIISGMYPAALGAQHMRSLVPMPNGLMMYPQYLREAGYYCTNNSKEDYNLEKPGQIWDESGRKGHWKNRKEGQPFFAIFNDTVSHESKIRVRPHTKVHDPNEVRVPAYHPDTPEVRQDWAQYYDIMTRMDANAGAKLKELADAGLEDETIIFYYGDHGSGMPRSKRWPYNSGLHVPLIVYFPEKFKHLAPPEYQAGGSSDRLVSFVDLAPTLLSICGIQPLDHMQGHAFAGPQCTEKQPYIYGFRGRMDERYDMVRSIRDQRYVYIRNYMPHRIYGQYIAYMFVTPTTQVWKKKFDLGELNPAQQIFWKEKAIEELYDLETDPDEVNNLAQDAAHQNKLSELRGAMDKWLIDINDLGFLPEAMFHELAGGQSPYDWAKRSGKIELGSGRHIANRLVNLDREKGESLVDDFQLTSQAGRYWTAQTVLLMGSSGVEKNRDSLHKSLSDESRSVRIVAAEALGRFGNKKDLKTALPVLVELADLRENDLYTVMAALNAIDYLDEKALPMKEKIAALPLKSQSQGKFKSYVPNLIKKILSDLNEQDL